MAPYLLLNHQVDCYQVLFPLIPQSCDLERMKQGGEHWQWDSDIPFYIGVLPRRGAKASDVKVLPPTRSGNLF